jgi:tRNA(Leu) C34 or U34 (ribose-2'-O)-methylase TrmL
MYSSIPQNRNGIYIRREVKRKPEDGPMETSRIARLLITAGLAMGLTAGTGFAQSAGQDMKNAGHETKDAATDAAHGTAKGTKKAYHATKKGTTTAAHKTAKGTEKAVDKTGDAAKTVGHDSKAVAKETGRRTQNAGDAIAGKPEKH